MEDEEKSDDAPSSNVDKVDSKDDTPKTSILRDVVLIASICLAQFLSLGSLAQTLVPLPIIAHDFGLAQPAKGSWLTAAFSLTAGTFILPAGRLGDIYGLKKMYIIGFLFFALWSFIAGFSVYGGFVMLCVCRGLQGIGSAIVVPNAMALVGTVYWHPSQEKTKNMCYALFGASAPTGFIAGSLIATLFAQLNWWPWGFWVMAVILGGNAVMAYFVLPSDSELAKQGRMALKLEHGHEMDVSKSEDSPKPENNEAKENEGPEKIVFDHWGALTGVIGLVLFSFVWNQAAVQSWSSPYIIVVLILSVISLVAFYFIETKVAKQPLVPFAQLSSRSILTLSVLTCGWGSFGIWTFYFFQIQQILRGYLPLSVVAQDAAVIPSGLIAGILSGVLLSRINVSWILLMATCAFLVGQCLLATVPIGQSFWIQTFLSLIIMPFGMDMSFPSGTALISAGMPVRYQGTASSLVDTVVNYSISLGLGFAGTIEKNVGGPLTESIIGAGPPGPTGQTGLYPGGDLAKNAALLRGYRASFYFAIALDVAGVIIAAGFVASDLLKARRNKTSKSASSDEARHDCSSGKECLEQKS